MSLKLINDLLIEYVKAYKDELDIHPRNVRVVLTYMGVEYEVSHHRGVTDEESLSPKVELILKKVGEV